MVNQEELIPAEHNLNVQMPVKNQERVGVFNLIAFRKESNIIKKQGQDVVVYRRVSRPLTELYAELQYVKSTLKSTEAVEVCIDGLANIKMGLDFYSAIKKAGVVITDAWFGDVIKHFDLEDASVPRLSFKVWDIVSIDKIARVSQRFKANYEPHVD